MILLGASATWGLLRGVRRSSGISRTVWAAPSPHCFAVAGGWTWLARPSGFIPSQLHSASGCRAIGFSAEALSLLAPEDLVSFDAETEVCGVGEQRAARTRAAPFTSQRFSNSRHRSRFAARQASVFTLTQSR